MTDPFDEFLDVWKKKLIPAQVMAGRFSREQGDLISVWLTYHVGELKRKCALQQEVQQKEIEALKKENEDLKKLCGNASVQGVQEGGNVPQEHTDRESIIRVILVTAVILITPFPYLLAR